MLRHWFSIGGRLGRAAYNSLSVVAIVLMVVAQVVFMSPIFIPPLPEGPITLASIPLGWNAVIAGAIAAVAVWIAISSSVRRLHDLGWSGMWLVLCLAPLIELALAAGVGLMIVLSFLRGTRGPNDYGDKTPPNMIA